jgi:hypothetical protein
MWLFTSRPRSVLILVPALVVLHACSVGPAVSVSPTATSTSGPTATPAPHATVAQVSNSQSFANSFSGGTSAPCANGDPLISGDCGVTVTVTCAGGDVVLSGGWTVAGLAVSDYYAGVTSSYPSSASAWTITAHDEGQSDTPHALTVTAYAECLHANFSAGVSAVSSTPSFPSDGLAHAVTVNCAPGSIVTGGGFRGTYGTAETIPAANGWTVDLVTPLGASAKPSSLFALCARTHLAAASQPKATASHIVTTYPDDDLTVSCPAATMLVGGGAQTGLGGLTTLTANGAVTQWHMHVRGLFVFGGSPGTYSVADYAVCVTVS